MRVSELAHRYAKALFDATPAEAQDRVVEELRTVEAILAKDKTIDEFLGSPILKAEDKERALAAALSSSGLRPEALSFILLLAKKNRIRLLSEIVEALRVRSDENHGVSRGGVRSATVLSPDERRRIEDIVGKFTKRQVILSYKEDAEVIGGLIAEVGSFTFDDTLTSHLRRLKDEMTRRV